MQIHPALGEALQCHLYAQEALERARTLRVGSG